MAQDIVVDKEIETIDSLIEYHQFDEAGIKADNLYKRLSEKHSSKTYQKQLLKVRFQQGLIADKRYLHKESFSIFLEVLEKAKKNKFLPACLCN